MQETQWKFVAIPHPPTPTPLLMHTSWLIEWVRDLIVHSLNDLDWYDDPMAFFILGCVLGENPPHAIG